MKDRATKQDYVTLVDNLQGLIDFAAAWLKRTPDYKRAHGALVKRIDGKYCYCALGAYGKARVGLSVRDMQAASGGYSDVFFGAKRFDSDARDIVSSIIATTYDCSDSGTHHPDSVQQLYVWRATRQLNRLRDLLKRNRGIDLPLQE